MRLSDLQKKEIVNIYDGKRIGVIVDVVISENGSLVELILEERRGRKFNHDEFKISWKQIIKIGDDIILIDTRNK